MPRSKKNAVAPSGLSGGPPGDLADSLRSAAFVRAAAAVRGATERLITARKAFGRAYRDYKTHAPSIAVSRFWAIVDEYRNQLAVRLRTGRGPNVAANAALALAAHAVTGSQCFFAPNSLPVLAAFNREYNSRVSALAAALDASRFELGRSDDSFGDLCDALPLAGRAVCRRVLAKDFHSSASFERAVRQATHAHGAALGRSILEDESNHAVHLDAALRHFLQVSMRDHETIGEG